MDALPPEVLRLVAGHLHHSARWPFARTCRIFYGIIRPSLFRIISLSLTHFAGHLDSQQVELHAEILSGKQSGRSPGDHAEAVVVLFECGDESAQGAIASPLGILEALSMLLSMTTAIRKLVINGMPGSVLSSTTEKHAMELQRFQQALRQLARLTSLEIAAKDGAGNNSSQWLQAVLPNLPDSVHKLFLMPIFPANSRSTGASLPPTYRIPIKDLYFSCPQAGVACDRLLSSVLDNSPELEVLCVGDQHLSAANVQALFGKNRSYEHLRLETGGIPAVSDCRRGLLSQTNLKHMDASCGSDFLYYLASLPPILVSLKLDIHILDPLAFGRERGCLLLGEVWDLLEPCLGNREWCPQLSLLHIKLRPWDEEIGFDHYEEEAMDLRKKALKLIRKRKIVPRINKGFCKLQV